MLTERAAHYFSHQFPDSGRSVEELIQKWWLAHRERYTPTEVKDFIVRYQEQLDVYHNAFRAVAAAIAEPAPKLKVVTKTKSKPKPKAKAKK